METNQHFTQLERDCAIDIILRYKGVIENKETDGVTNKQKLEAWDNIAKEYNSCNINVPRSGKQLKNLYENTKRKLKKQISNEKVERYKTGGGPGPSLVLQPSQEKIVSAIKGQITPLPNIYHSNKNYCKGTETISEKLEDLELNLQINQIESISVNEGLHDETEQIQNLDEVEMIFTDGNVNEIKECHETPVKSTKKRTLADVYEDVVTVTSEKKKKLQSKEAYSCVNNQHKQQIYTMEKNLKNQEFEHNEMANALKIKILTYEEKLKEMESKKGEIEFKKAEIELKKAEIELREKEIEFKNNYGC